MKILITGGAGFIGGHTADELIKEGHKVIILDNLSEPVHINREPYYINPKADLIIGDVTQKKDFEKALCDVDIVFHLAAYQDYMNDFSKFFYTNTVSTALLYEIIVEKKLNIKKVIIASSQAVYGEGKYLNKEGHVIFPDIRKKEQLLNKNWEFFENGFLLKPSWTNESQVNPQNQYALSKYTQELVSLNLGKRFDVPTVCMRYSIVQGPRQSIHNAYSGVCRIFSLAYFHDKQPVIFEDGQQIRDFVNIEDVIRANILVMHDERANFQCFNVGSGKRYTILEFAEATARIYNREFNPILKNDFRFGDTRNIFSDITKLKQLGWFPINDINYSLKKYAEWLETQNSSIKIVEEAITKMVNTNVIMKANRLEKE